MLVDDIAVDIGRTVDLALGPLGEFIVAEFVPRRVAGDVADALSGSVDFPQGEGKGIDCA